MKKRMASILLAVVLALSLLPTAALAATPQPPRRPTGTQSLMRPSAR